MLDDTCEAGFDPGESILVMAHPDDEILWASSILGAARAVVLCFGDTHRPEVSAGRREVIGTYPRPDVSCLGVPEAGMFERADWPDPRPSPFGLAPRPDLPRRDADRPRRYAANHARLTRLLGDRLAGARTVVTHNPWGEYGHEEHAQVFRVVERLSRELGFALWVTGYVSDKSARLMLGSIADLGAAVATLPTNPALATRLMARYVETRSWTWREDHVWPATETFLLWSPGAGLRRPGRALPLTYLDLGWVPKPRGSRPRRALRLLANAAAAPFGPRT